VLGSYVMFSGIKIIIESLETTEPGGKIVGAQAL
jgi:hypothetical protein